MVSRSLSTACLLYLLLPCLVFLGGWVQPWLAWPVGIMLTGCVLWVASQCQARPVQWSLAGAVRLALLLGLGWVWVQSIGLGGWVAQSGDCTVRNAIYAALVRDSWPLTVQGDAFIYYLGCWLPPALAAKLGAPAELALELWVLLGVWLALLAVAAGKGTRRALVFLVILLLLGDMMNWVNRAYYKMLAGSEYDIFQDWVLFFDLHFTPSCVQLRNTFNHYLAPLVLLAMLAGKLLPRRYGLAAGALVLICSPLAAIALLPLLLWKGRLSLFNWSTAVAALFALLPACYLAGGAGGQLALLRPAGDSCLASLETCRLWMRYGIQVLLIALPALLLLRRWRRTSWFSCSLLLAVVLPLLWVGMWNNEFIYKGAAVLWFCLAWLYSSAWCHSHGRRKALLAVFLLLSASDAYGQLVGALKSFSTQPAAMQQNIRNEWQGDLHQPQDARAAQFKGAPLLPKLFLF